MLCSHWLCHGSAKKLWGLKFRLQIRVRWFEWWFENIIAHHWSVRIHGLLCHSPSGDEDYRKYDKYTLPQANSKYTTWWNVNNTPVYTHQASACISGASTDVGYEEWEIKSLLAFTVCWRTDSPKPQLLHTPFVLNSRLLMFPTIRSSLCPLKGTRSSLLWSKITVGNSATDWYCYYSAALS